MTIGMVGMDIFGETDGGENGSPPGGWSNGRRGRRTGAGSGDRGRGVHLLSLLIRSTLEADANAGDRWLAWWVDEGRGLFERA